MKNLWTEINQMICNHYECSDKDNNQYPECTLRHDDGAICAVNRHRDVFYKALRIANKYIFPPIEE